MPQLCKRRCKITRVACGEGGTYLTLGVVRRPLLSINIYQSSPLFHSTSTYAISYSYKHSKASQSHPANTIAIMIPKARTFTRSTGVIVGAAGVATASPLLFFIPGAEERLAAQAAKWGPRWNRGFARVSPAVQRSATRVEPGVKKGVKIVEPPLKRAAM